MSLNPERTSPRGKGVGQAEAYLNKGRIGYRPHVLRRHVVSLTVTGSKIDDRVRRAPHGAGREVGSESLRGPNSAQQEPASNANATTRERGERCIIARK